MLAPWAQDEMEQAAWEDKRLNERLRKLLSALGERPQVSIPAACGGHAETIAAYRFFDNDQVTLEKVLEPHFERTRQRVAEHPVVLLVQDTTELDVTRPAQQVAGAGPLDSSARRGALLHPLEAFTPDGTPLGAVWAQAWTRDEEPVAESRQERQRWRRTAPIEAKESFCWLQGLRAARQVAQQVPQTTCVCIADSEADIYELFAEERGDVPVDWLIRAAQDRLLDAAPAAEESSGADELAALRQIRAAALAASVLFTKEISVRGRQLQIACKTGSRQQPRESRKAQVEVRATTVTLRPPWRAGSQIGRAHV